MPRKLFAAVLVLAGVSGARADTVDISVVPGEPPPPVGVFTVDVFNDLNFDRRWIASGIRADAFAGATFRYRFADEIDPNDPHEPLLTNVEPDNVTRDRNVTFVSQPRGQTVDQRFRAGGAPQIAGGYDPPTALATADLTTYNVAFFDEVPPGEEAADGYVTRLSLDVPVALEGTLYITTIGPREPSDVLVVDAHAVATTGIETPFPYLRFQIFSTIPEPAVVTLVALGAAMALRRR